MGVSAARNKGIDYAVKTSNHGYITFVDSDDFVEKNYIEELANAFYEDDVDMSACGFFRVNEKGDIIAKARLNGAILNQDAALISLLEKYERGGIYGFAWCKMFKKSLLSNVRFNQSMVQMEDVEFVCRYLMECRKVAVINKNLYYYVENPYSCLANANLDPKYPLSTFYAAKSMYDITKNFDEDVRIYYKQAYFKKILQVGQILILKTKDKMLMKHLAVLSADLRTHVNELSHCMISKKLLFLAYVLALSPRLFRMCVKVRYKPE